MDSWQLWSNELARSPALFLHERAGEREQRAEREEEAAETEGKGGLVRPGRDPLTQHPISPAVPPLLVLVLVLLEYGGHLDSLVSQCVVCVCDVGLCGGDELVSLGALYLAVCVRVCLIGRVWVKI